MNILKSVYNRIYNDFLMSSRLDEYEMIIKKSLEYGYEHISIKDYYKKLKSNKLEDKKYFLHRHDIDTDIRTTKKIFKIEQKYNIQSTYYFRLSTLNFKLMKDIDSYGSEASYHFEEIAQYSKNNHIKSKSKVIKDLDSIKELFINNIKYIEKECNLKIKTVASHGDFVNRKLEITNNELTNDLNLRKKINLLCESYDKELMNSFDIYISDKQYPVFYYPQNIFDVLGKYNTICMLTHPRQWETNIFVNIFDNLKRIWEGIKW